MAYDTSYFRPMVDETARGSGLLSSQEVRIASLWICLFSPFAVPESHAKLTKTRSYTHLICRIVELSITSYSPIPALDACI